MFEAFIQKIEVLFWGKPLFIFLVIATTILLANLFNKMLQKSYLNVMLLRQKHEKLTEVMSLMDKTQFNMFRRFMVSLVYILGIVLIISLIPELKEISLSIFAGAGVIAIIIGFATQNLVSNIIAGVFISVFEPFRLDDRVLIGDESGYIEDITLWHTTIRTFNNQRLMIPNSIIAKEKIINYSITDEKTLNFIDFSISYDSDIDLAKQIISEELEKSQYFTKNDEYHQFLAKEEPYYIRVIELAEYAVKVRLYAWTWRAAEGYLMQCELFEKVKKRFDAEGIEIPFPYRTIVEKKDQNKKTKKVSKVKKAKKTQKVRKKTKL